jgi:hypothetical protein
LLSAPLSQGIGAEDSSQKRSSFVGSEQFKRANRSMRKLKTYLGRVIRDIGDRSSASWR